jgi:cell division protein FtsB
LRFWRCRRALQQSTIAAHQMQINALAEAVKELKAEVKDMRKEK